MFKGRDYHLDTAGTNFDLEHPTTYSVVCLLGAKMFWEDSLHPQVATPNVNNTVGPFQIPLVGMDNATITLQNPSGQTWQSTLSTDPSSESVWQTPAKCRLSALSASTFGTSKSPQVATINRFAILQHNPVDLTQMETDNPVPH